MALPTSSAAAAAPPAKNPRLDPAAAVAALHAAGEDVEALEEAIEKASFLDETPGDDRQKLRAARFRLKNLLEQQARGSQDTANRSPHAKARYDVAEFDALTAHYEKLTWRLISRPGGAVAKPDDFYRLYALHMQATRGDNTSERPVWAERGGLDYEGRARWDAWTALKGLEGDKARLRFVRVFWEFSPQALYKDTRGDVAAALAAPAAAATDGTPAAA